MKKGLGSKKGQNDLFFPQRIPEPKEMEKIELDAFEQLSKENYARWLIPLVDDILQQSKLKSGVILDVACGPGLLARELAMRSKNFRVVGIDISQYGIKLAKENCRGITNAIFKIADINKLPFEDHSFDLVVCKDSLHHFANLERALKEMLRVTKNGCLVYLQDLRRDLPQYLLRRSIPPDTIIKKLQFYSTRAAYTKEELKKIMKDLHIKNYEIKTRKVTTLLGKRYERIKINPKQLKQGFETRYIATVTKR